MKKQQSLVLGVGLILFAVVASAGIPFQVISTGTVGVVTRFNKVTGTTLQPGFNWKMPFIDSVIVFNIRSQKGAFKSQAATKDLQDVTTDVAVVYKLKEQDIQTIFSQIGDNERISEVIINPIVQESIKQTTARFTAEELITKRDEVKKQIDDSLSIQLAGYSITLEEVAITNFEFSKQFSNAVEAKQVAEQKAKQAAYELEQAKKEVETFKLQAQALSEFTLRKMFIEKWDGKLPTVVTDAYLLKALPESSK